MLSKRSRVDHDDELLILRRSGNDFVKFLLTILFQDLGYPSLDYFHITHVQLELLAKRFQSLFIVIDRLSDLSDVGVCFVWVVRILIVLLLNVIFICIWLIFILIFRIIILLIILFNISFFADFLVDLIFLIIVVWVSLRLDLATRILTILTNFLDTSTIF